jgi:adenylate cyclase
MTAAGLLCGSCGTELRENDNFCHECGTPIAPATLPAEYKQVTVLFADVVRSMDIAAEVGPERLREIMTQLVERSAVEVAVLEPISTDGWTVDGLDARVAEVRQKFVDTLDDWPNPGEVP